MRFMITSEQILWMCTCLVTIWGAWNVVQQIRKPSTDQKAKIELHEEMLGEHAELLDKDHQRLTDLELGYRKILEQQADQNRINIENDKRAKEEEESRKVMMKSLYVIINHMITGNGEEQLKNVRDDLNNYLIEK